MKIIESPNPNFALNDGSTSLFLAGGISNCPDWQTEILTLLRGNLTIYNPRRKDFPIHNKSAAAFQIEWEHERLEQSHAILFWFARGSLNPIVLYELGRWGNSGCKKIFIGCDPEYTRTQDVKIQTQLSKPDVEVVDSLEKLANQVNKYVKL